MSSFSKSANGVFGTIFMLLAAAGGQAIAQQVTVSLASGSAVSGGTVALNVSLANSGGALPVAVQWTMSYSSSVVVSVSAATGASATAAGKSVTCSNKTGATTCVAYGMNNNTIGPGVLATATFSISPTAPTSSATVQVSAVAGSTAAGVGIAGASQGGAISVTQPSLPILSGLACVPATVNAPGTALCTVSLTAAALSAFGVTITSNNSSVSVPAAVTVPLAGLTIVFTATVASVSSAQTAILTATSGTVSKTFSLSIVPPGSWSISGALTSSGSGATVTLSGSASRTASADASGNYTFSGLANGNYVVAPSKSGFAFTPASRAVTINGANQTAINFTAQAQAQTWTISGTITPAASAGGATVALSGSSNATTTVNVSGNYTFSGLANGNYTVTPTKTSFAFTPASATVTINGANQTAGALTIEAVRNDWTGFAGMQLTVASNPISVSRVGRVCIAGSSGTHTVKFVAAATGVDVPGASADVNMLNCPASQFAYASLAAPVTLQPGTSYYLVSHEVVGGDFWYNHGPIPPPPADVAVTNSIYFNGTSWIAEDGPNTSHVPPTFEYTVLAGSAPAFVTGYNLNSGPLRNNSSGWRGMKFTVGASGMAVNSLGRIFVAGNSRTHVVKLVRASDGKDVTGGSVSVSMAGGTVGQFSYAALASPITLQANTAYYLVSQESTGGDQWYDLGTVSTTSAGAVNSGVYSSNSANWTTRGGANSSYVPPNLK